MHRNNFQQAVEDGGHYANMGMEWRENSFSIDEMIREAGRKMYEEKHADNFLAVLAFRLRGVYFVGLSTDSIRSIYILVYFKEILMTAEAGKELVLKYQRKHGGRILLRIYRSNDDSMEKQGDDLAVSQCG